MKEIGRLARQLKAARRPAVDLDRDRTARLQSTSPP
jgi:hypothetical protein